MEEGTGEEERGQGEAGEEELSAGLPNEEQPLLLLELKKKQAAAAGWRRGEDEHCLTVKL